MSCDVNKRIKATWCNYNKKGTVQQSYNEGTTTNWSFAMKPRKKEAGNQIEKNWKEELDFKYCVKANLYLNFPMPLTYYSTLCLRTSAKLAPGYLLLLKWQDLVDSCLGEKAEWGLLPGTPKSKPFIEVHTSYFLWKYYLRQANLPRNYGEVMHCNDIFGYSIQK